MSMLHVHTCTHSLTCGGVKHVLSQFTLGFQALEHLTHTGIRIHTLERLLGEGEEGGIECTELAKRKRQPCFDVKLIVCSDGLSQE